MSSPRAHEIAGLQKSLAGVGYIAEPSLAAALLLMRDLARPLLLEGDAGVGKTEVAKALAEINRTRLIRLQCYEGLDAHSAMYEWNYQRQLLAIKLLEKGLEKNPTRWQYAHDIGFINYWYTRDYAAATQWFERASKMPGAPEWIAPLAAITLVQGGDRTRARGLLTNLANSATEKFIRAAAERGLAQLQALDAIDELTSLVQDHERRTGQTVRGWHDLPQFGGGVPGDPTGQPYVYDAATRTVDLSPLSTLRPLPKVKSQQ